jgi:hypothetical protein
MEFNADDSIAPVKQTLWARAAAAARPGVREPHSRHS